MVLCNFFANGNCRFGSKCMNDHIDFKALLKNEVDAAVNGKQWLISCFGPFKESAVIPGILDRSFEEVRIDFLEANKNGTVQQHINELVAQYGDSLAKLNHLKLATPDTIQLVANIYNQSVQEPKKPTTTSNVFALSNTAPIQAQQQQNPFQMGSVFGGSQQMQQQNPSAMNTNIFGSSVPNNPFQSSNSSSIFGGPKEQPTVASNFSMSQQTQVTPQTSIFGSSQPQQPTQHKSIFGSTQVETQQLQPSASVFGGQSVFGAPTSIFASAIPQPNQQQQQPQQQQGTSMFAPSIFSQSQNPAQASGIFGSVQPAPVSTFSQPAPNIFGGFQPQAEVPQQNSGNIFAQSQNTFNIQQQQQTLPAPSGSIFQIQQPTASAPSFGGNPFQTQPPTVDENAYSKLEELTQEEIQAFQADTFQIGRIPLKPPPKQFCI